MENIHWFPGHMNKAFHKIEEDIKNIDIVIEVLDARAPFSSSNPYLEQLIKNKKHLIIFSKSDLADNTKVQKWINYFSNKSNLILLTNLNDKSISITINKALCKLSQEKWDKQKLKGMKPQPTKIMVLGITNVGKSSLINLLSKKKIAGVQNKPGFTRNEQLINIDNKFLLLDTPGILPMNFENEEVSIKLALLGSIREEILPNEKLTEWLIEFLKNNYPYSLDKRFKIQDLNKCDNVIEEICKNRKFVAKNNILDLSKGHYIFLKEFKDGLLGNISLE